MYQHIKFDRRFNTIVEAGHKRNKKVKRLKRIDYKNRRIGTLLILGIVLSTFGIIGHAQTFEPKAEVAQAQTEEVPEREVISRESRSFESADIPKDYVDPNIKEEKALAELMGNESGGEPGRINKTSLACGVGQAYPCTKLYPHATRAWILKNKIVKGDKWYIPNQGKEFETNWMKDYIKNRYGTATNALKFWKSQSPHWY